VKVSDLTAQLQQEAAETTETVKQMQIDALEKLRKDLERQCSDAESTLKSALETALASMKSAVRENADVMNVQLARAKADVMFWPPKFFWAVKAGVMLPIGMTMLLCALVVLATWVWMPRELWNVHTSHRNMVDGRQYLVIEDPQWTRCNISQDSKNPIYRPCKTIEPEQGK